MMGLEPQIWVGVGSFIGGVMAGIFGGRKLEWASTVPYIEKSVRTSGALHISEEGLEKIDRFETVLKKEYLTETRHADLCGKRMLEIKLLISEELKAHTKEILDAIRDTAPKERNGSQVT